MTSTPSPASRRQAQLRVCRVPHGLSLTALACALLAGCAAPVSAPVDNSLPAGWVQQPQAAAGKPQPMTEADLRDWWRRFDDAELNALVDEALANWWQEFQQADEARREDLIAQVREEQRAKPKGAPGAAKRSPKKPANTGHDASTLNQVAQQAMDSDGDNATDAPAKKRRRRRRKPGGAGQSADSVGGAD